MYELTVADSIWNRACQSGGDSPSAGDSALSALLLFHGISMNGGVLHAVESLSPDELVAARVGYSYFGFACIADLIGKAQEAINQEQNLQDFETKLDREYWTAIPDDGTLFEAFTVHFNSNPGEYLLLVSD